MITRKKTVPKPWGSYTIIEQGEGYWIKNIFVKKRESLSLQSHKYRTETWFVVSGKINAVKGNSKIKLKSGDCLRINKREKHRISAMENSHIIEIAFGKPDENDIVRFEDNYGRID